MNPTRRIAATTLAALTVTGSIVVGAQAASAWTPLVIAAVDGRGPTSSTSDGTWVFDATSRTPELRASSSQASGTLAFRIGSETLCTVPIASGQVASCRAEHPIPDGRSSLTAVVTDRAGAVVAEARAGADTPRSAPEDLAAVVHDGVTTVTGTARPDTDVHVRESRGGPVTSGRTAADGRFSVEAAGLRAGAQVIVWDGAASGRGAGPAAHVKVVAGDGTDPGDGGAEPIGATPAPGLVDPGFTPGAGTGTPGQQETLRDVHGVYDAPERTTTVTGAAPAGATVSFTWGWGGAASTTVDADGSFTWMASQQLDRVRVGLVGTAQSVQIDVENAGTATPQPENGLSRLRAVWDATAEPSPSPARHRPGPRSSCAGASTLRSTSSPTNTAPSGRCSAAPPRGSR